MSPASAYGIFDDLVRCETRLYNALDSDLRARHDLGATQFELLRYLRDHPDSRVVDLSVAFAAGIGAISKITDRLQAEGLVDRERNPADRRSSFLRLTATGRRRLTAAERTFDRRLDALLTQLLPPRRLESAAAALRDLRDALERDRIGMPVG